MKSLLIIIIVFLVVFYVYTYIKYKKRKKNQIDAVGKYRKTYLEKDSAPPESKDGYTNYLTKYNSTLDYIEKDAFINDLTEEQDAEKFKPKKFQF